MRYIFKISVFFLCLICSAVVFSGCSANSKKVTTETTYHEDYNPDVDNKAHVTNESTTTETEDDESGGVLSSTVDVIGEIIALPFRAVAGFFRWIF